MSSNPAKTAFEAELIEAIQDESLYFDMSYFRTEDRDADLADGRRPYWLDGEPPVTSCETASCMAGHIQALRPELARELAPAYRGMRGLAHDQLARAIYERVTGELCRLDFYGSNSDKKFLDELTREDAVRHIRGEHEDWPLLARFETEGDE